MKPGTLRTGVLTGVLWWIATTPSAGATEDLPEVLRYARQYVHQEKGAADRNLARTVRSPSPKGTAQQLASTELILRQQQIKIDALEKQLQESAREQQVQVPARQRLLQERDAARTALTRVGEETAKLEIVAAQLRAQVSQAEGVLKMKDKEVAALKVRVTEMKQRQAEQLKRLEQEKGPVSLASEPARQAYATGVMYARDVREAQEGNRLLGVVLDQQALQAGLNDGLSGGKLRLTPEELAKAGQSVEEAAGRGYQTVTSAQKVQAGKYLKTFRKQKGTAQDKQGFWYRVTYPGDGAWLQDEDVVDVVVEESLTDGTVVSDMDRSGSSLRQAVREFPPVFGAGLKYLRDHGQITLVVPPDLAYGERGYPPSIPPGATVVYRIRVAGVVMPAPADNKQKPAGG